MKVVKTIILATALLTFLGSQETRASTIASCQNSEGYSYFAYRNLTLKEGAGWQKDKISKGQITLTQSDNGDFDILILGAGGGVFSSRDEGAKIFAIAQSYTAITVIVIYPGITTETYSFQILKDDRKQVIWTQVKTETPIPKGAVFVADCDFFDFNQLKRGNER